MAASRKAREQFESLVGRTPESIIGVQKTSEGWTVSMEVVESRRVPDTADLLAEYEVSLSPDAELLGYSRTSRYVRGRPS
ncbi:gas vesicle protein [Nesterenkonia pannonica]|uniref:gas vesicle protein GvpO n=1 Tax=Nesterenkonia pannonica TaxID=1548602 RepID=UPI002164E48C|nr:gas vesicle protein [Nesterenkonia pannonica]